MITLSGFWKFKIAIFFYFEYNSTINCSLIFSGICSLSGIDTNSPSSLSLLNLIHSYSELFSSKELSIAFKDFDFSLIDTLSPGLSVYDGIFTIDPGLTLHFYDNNNIQLGQTFAKDISDIRPNLRINLQYKKTESLRLTYRKNTQFTDINNLAEGFVFNNYNSIFQGNRELEAAVVNNYNLNYRSINQFTFTNIFANANYSKRSNSIQSRANINGIDAIRTSTNSNFPSYNVSWTVIHNSSHA